MKKRVAVLTSGGDAPGMNAAIRAVFRCAKMRDPANEIVLFKNGFRGLAGRLEANMDFDVQRQELRGILTRGGTCIGTGRVDELRPVEPGAPDAAERLKARQSFIDVAVVNLFQLKVDGLVVIGGDGSYRGAHAIAEAYRERFDRPLRVVGIPATIDNDIHGTDYTIGFDTALSNTVDALNKIRDTVESHRRTVILEVMGNRSGWIALSAAIAGGASAVLLPEFPASFDQTDIVNRCIAALRGDYRYFIVVMAEGVKRASGDPDYGPHLAAAIQGNEEVSRLLGHPMSVRYNMIGHFTRGGTPSGFDNVLAARFGRGAVQAIFDEVPLPAGAIDFAVALQGRQLVYMPLGSVVRNGPRRIKPDDELYKVAEDMVVHEHQPF